MLKPLIFEFLVSYIDLDKPYPGPVPMRFELDEILDVYTDSGTEDSFEILVQDPEGLVVYGIVGNANATDNRTLRSDLIALLGLEKF